MKYGLQTLPIIMHVQTERYNIGVYCTDSSKNQLIFALVNSLLFGSNRLHLLLFTYHK